MIKINYDDNSFEEVPAGVYKNAEMLSSDFNAYGKKIVSITIPKEIEDVNIGINNSLILKFEEGIKTIKIWHLVIDYLVIPKSCTTLTLLNCKINTLFIPKNVIDLYTYLKYDREIIYNSNITNCWIDGRYTRINHYDGFSNLSSFNNIRFHPMYYHKNISFLIPDSCIYNEPLTNIINRNLYASTFNNNVCICEDYTRGVKVGIQLTRNQYLEKFGEGKCPYEKGPIIQTKETIKLHKSSKK